MKKFKLFSLLLLSIGMFFAGCQKDKIATDPVKIHWDRDVCQRCKMAISERKYAFEVVNPHNGKVYKFDDIGCGLLWMGETKISWIDDAVLWVSDAKNGKWINARKAYYTDESITPMAYGIAAYSKEDVPKNSKTIDFAKAKKIVYKIEKLNMQKLKEMRKQ
ncbi:MAG: hypothetical protein R3331_04580 [Sulfurospirillaceae bacterium]|nr:hypothetical protein [Sulfurospirillaceae bacterium]